MVIAKISPTFPKLSPNIQCFNRYPKYILRLK